MSPDGRSDKTYVPPFGIRGVGALDVAWALALSIFGALLAGGFGKPHTAAEGGAAAVGVLLMTAPVALARRWPVPVAVTLAGGAALNWALLGHLVRCGAALPAVFFVAFIVGSQCITWGPTVLGAGSVGANVVCQSLSDPQLGANVIVYLVPIALVFLAVGRLVSSRNATVRRLRARAEELQRQREQTARLAVAADQWRIAEDLDGYLHDRVGRIAVAAVRGRDRVTSGPGLAEADFVEIQDVGRETLAHMREVVADLRHPAVVEPQPVLAQLDRLLARATSARTRLRVSGDPRPLAPGVELSGYRIVEHLLATVADDPAAQVEVGVRFGADELELTLIGPGVRPGAARPALAAACQRAALHGGTVRVRTARGRYESVAVLPLDPWHV